MNTPLKMTLDFRGERMRSGKSVFVLSHSPNLPSRDWTVQVHIRFYYGDPGPDANPNHYRFFMFSDQGEQNELVTHQDWADRYQSIVDNANQGAAEIWAAQTDWVIADGSEHSLQWAACQQMVKQWEAMQMLGLFSPTVTG